jgi:hypothetical protein
MGKKEKKSKSKKKNRAQIQEVASLFSQPALEVVKEL